MVLCEAMAHELVNRCTRCHETVRGATVVATGLCRVSMLNLCVYLLPGVLCCAPFRVRAALHAASVRPETTCGTGTARASAAPTAIEVKGAAAKRPSGGRKRRNVSDDEKQQESDDDEERKSGSERKAKPPTPKKRQKTVKKSAPKAKPKAAKKSPAPPKAPAAARKKSAPKAQKATAKRRKKNDYVPDSEDDDY